MGLLSYLWFLFSFLLFVSLPMLSVKACNFPTYMQTNGIKRDWIGSIKNQNSDFTLKINITGNMMKVVSKSSTETSHTRVCLQIINSDKYLVAHEQAGQSSMKYTCIMFISRSNDVIQIKEAPLSSSMENVCEETKLVLNPWLIIDSNGVHNNVQLCPLVGGFSVRVYDKLMGVGVCDGYEGQTRIESECAKGEGLYFFFRQQKCVPRELFMYKKQQTLCLANWQQDRYKFVLLRHNHNDLKYMWILRYPASQGDSFIAVLLMDLVADVGRHVTKTNNHLRLDMVRDTPRPANALCLDDYEMCSVYSNPCTTPELRLTCPRTCRICDETKPVVCNFEQKYQAQWYNAANPATLAMTVNSTIVTTYNGQRQEKYHCINWDPEADNNQSKYIDKQMLVKEFNNGCRPRYSCIEIMQHSSTVLFFKLSEELMWPFTKTASETLDCRHFSFEDDASLTPSLFKTKFLNLVYLRASNAVQCDIPDNINNYTVEFKSRTRCTVSVVLNKDRNKFTLEMPNCANTDIETHFTCVDSSRMLPKRDQLVVTRSVSNPDLIHCWAFPKRQENIFYLLNAKECNEAIRKRLNKDRLRYLAVFSPTGVIPSIDSDNNKSNAPETAYTTPPRDRVITPHNKHPTHNVRKTNSYRPKYNSPDTTDVSLNDDHRVLETDISRDHKNKTAGVGEEDDFTVTATSVAVVGVVIIFAMLQTLCICKS